MNNNKVEIYFIFNFQPLFLVGRNGSGKSNFFYGKFEFAYFKYCILITI